MDHVVATFNKRLRIKERSPSQPFWPFVIKYTENFRFLYGSGTLQDLTLLEARNGGQKKILYLYIKKNTQKFALLGVN